MFPDNRIAGSAASRVNLATGQEAAEVGVQRLHQ
jgi:hypothetical protein